MTGFWERADLGSGRACQAMRGVGERFLPYVCGFVSAYWSRVALLREIAYGDVEVLRSLGVWERLMTGAPPFGFMESGWFRRQRKLIPT